MAMWRFHNITTDNDFWPLLPSISITSSQPCGLANFSGTIHDSDDVSDGDEVEVLYAEDDVTFVRLFAGFISIQTDAHDEPVATPAVYEFAARDYTTLLDDTIINIARNVTETIEERVLWIMSQGNSFGITTSGVEANSSPIGPWESEWMSKRSALDKAAGVGGSVFYVNFDKDLQFYEPQTVIAAPFDLATPSSPPTSYPYVNFRKTRDRTQQADQVLVVNTDGQVVTRTRVGAPIASLRKQRLITTSLVNQADMEVLGDFELDRIGLAQVSGTLVIRQSGLFSGMTVHIVNPTHAVDDDFVISSVAVRYVAPNTPGSEDAGAEFTIGWADRLLCVPNLDTSAGPTTLPNDCTDCTRTVALLPSGMDSNLSLAERIGGMIIYDSPTLVNYNCAVQLIAGPVNTSGADLTIIDHEPVFEAVFAGDRAYYLGTVGTFGDTRWSNGSEVVTAGRVMDIRKAWAVEEAADPWIVTLGAGAPILECDGTDVVYTSDGSGVDTAEMKHDGPGPWSDGDFDLYINDIEFSAAHNNVQFLWYYGANNERYIALVRSAGQWTLEVAGTSTSNASSPLSLSTATDYTIRWEHNGGVSRGKIWASSGAEPGTWDCTRDPSGDTAADTDEFFQFFQNTTASVVQKVSGLTFDGVTYDDFNRTTTSPDVGAPNGGGGSTGQLRRRDMVDGSLEAALFIRYATPDVRATQNGQHLMAILWDDDNGPFQRYSRTPTTEGGEFSITGWSTDLADWNVDDAYNVYKMTTDGVLTRYDAAGASVWSVDLQSLYNYYWPTRLSFGSAYGSGQTIIADSAKGRVYVCGYIGGADWQSGGSEACVLTLDRADGSLLNDRRFTTTGGNAATQAIAMQFAGACLWVAGAADGDNVEGNAISGVRGWIAKDRA